jgi:hypothetical protein
VALVRDALLSKHSPICGVDSEEWLSKSPTRRVSVRTSSATRKLSPALVLGASLKNEFLPILSSHSLAPDMMEPAPKYEDPLDAESSGVLAIVDLEVLVGEWSRLLAIVDLDVLFGEWSRLSSVIVDLCVLDVFNEDGVIVEHDARHSMVGISLTSSSSSTHFVVFCGELAASSSGFKLCKLNSQ